MKRRSLPLGIDLGSTKVRIAQRVRINSSVELDKVVTRPIPAGMVTTNGIAEPDYVSALIEEAVREIGGRERRCAAAVGFPQASLRVAVFPAMTPWERVRTAYYEVMGQLDYPAEEAVVRTRSVDGDPTRCAIGVVRSRALRERVACLRKAGLKVLTVDDEGCALRRALPRYDALLDIGYRRSRLYLTRACDVFQTEAGGAHVTSAIEKDLSIDESSAEKRKRILGTAGAGEAMRKELAGRIAALVQSARLICEVERVAAVGNGARLPGLTRDIALSSGAQVELAVSHVLESESYSADVTRAGAPDWTLAAALSV
jgi:Tfp pilus assembly PilM family ATPase